MQLQGSNSSQTIEINLAQRTLKRTVNALKEHHGRMNSLEEALGAKVNDSFQTFSVKLFRMASSLQEATLFVASQREMDTAKCDILDAKLSEVQEKLKAAVTCCSDDVGTKMIEIEAQLREAVSRGDLLEQSLHEARSENESNLRDFAISEDEYGRLCERLENAEKRAIEMSTNGAKAFARSSRTIAILEGECSRVRRTEQITNSDLFSLCISASLTCRSFSASKPKACWGY